MRQAIQAGRPQRDAAAQAYGLLGGILLVAILCFWAALAHAEGKAPSEATGADLYQRGFYPEALAEWKKAVAEQKDPGAAFRLGEEYFDAKVVPRDVAQAIRYYQFGAEHGDARAQMDLGSMYDKGWGLPRNAGEAAKWYEAAAKQGLAVAQYNIGTMYQAGEGVAKDDKMAYMYYLLAVQNGFPQFAGKELEKLSAEMTPDQIRQATVMARDFKAKTPAGETATR